MGNRASPLNSFDKIEQHAEFLTPSSERITKQAMLSLILPNLVTGRMDIADAKECIECVASKVVTRATKRKQEVAAAAGVEEAQKVAVGRARAAKRAAVAARPPKTQRVVDNAMRSRVF